jgi:hypothetical protein
MNNPGSQWGNLTDAQKEFLRKQYEGLDLSTRVIDDPRIFNELPLNKRQTLFALLNRPETIANVAALDTALVAAVAPPTQSTNPVIVAQDDSPTASTGQVTQDAQAATVDASRTQAPAPPQQQVDKDGKVVVASSTTAGSNATPAVAVDGITFGTDAATRPIIQTQATPVESPDAIQLRKPPVPTTVGTTNNVATLPEATTQIGRASCRERVSHQV